MMKMRTLSGQVYFYFAIVIVISLASVGFVSYFQASRALDTQVEQYMEQMIENVAYQTDIYLQTYELLSNTFSSNTDVRNFFEIGPNDSYEYYYYSNEIKNFASRSVQSIQTIYKQLNVIYIVGRQGRSVVYDNQNFLFSEAGLSPERYDWLMKAIPEDGSIVLLNTSFRPSDQGTVVTMARQVRGAAYTDFKGIVAIEFKLQELAKIWDRVNIGKEGYFFIVDETGKSIYHPPFAQPDEQVFKDIAAHLTDSNNKVFQAEYLGKNRMFVARKSDYSNWRLLASVPVSELRKPISTIRTTTIVVGLLTLIVALWLAWRFGRSLLAPIRELKDSMRETEKGNFQHIDEIERTDEIGGLVHSYNLMVTRLSEMINKVYAAELQQQKDALQIQETEIERHRAEFQTLQLQINPHFLYNTLETINCYAIVQDSHEITEMVEAMAFMLRYSIQTNLEEITVANELNHVRNYLIILQHRIDREFEIDVIIPPSLLLEKMVRLTLQPVIENCFQHAFPNGIEAHHRISIDARKQQGLFQVIVEDNGIGIPPERLRELQEQLKLNRLAEQQTESGYYRRGGIGLMNVHRRIQMVFGEQYGMQIESEWEQGSRIILSMPDIPKPIKI
ncbi:sensor histidine kinase [Paenibacillus sp. FSL H7-0331]|jgi:two-component system sensor histidine kinase YesM|uniref:cache domain-containing sensor histidine kinase n=1 Tax=Paenibacillus sp. FSL H7-0331 TaxID=1920421 RepID=UPI0026CDA939|nr:sensor histidine kinase [Paenibacillus sp. FSL H7-0331]